MAKRTYGIDEYGRYEEIDGERYFIEFWPFPVRSIRTAYCATRQALDVLRWHVGMITQQGLTTWWRERKL